jgi:hypothetical protein
MQARANLSVISRVTLAGLRNGALQYLEHRFTCYQDSVCMCVYSSEMQTCSSTCSNSWAPTNTRSLPKSANGLPSDSTGIQQAKDPYPWMENGRWAGIVWVQQAEGREGRSKGGGARLLWHGLK